MQHTHTFYQDVDSDEPMADISDELVYARPGSSVWLNGTQYKVSEIEDTIAGYNNVYRVIWCQKSEATDL